MNGLSSKRPAWPSIGVAGITLLAAALRFIRLDYLGLRIDEGFTLLYSRQSWAAVLGLDGYYAPHPPLFFALAKLGNVFVAESLASRVVAAVAGTATIPMVYLLGKRLLDERAGLAAALLVAVSPLHLEFSRDGRMYAPVTLAVVVAYDALIAYWQRPSIRTAVVYGLALAAAVYLDYSAAYALAPQALLLAGIVWKLRRRAAWLVGSAAVAVLAYAPWLPEIAATVDGVNEIDRRAEYLAATWRRVWNAIPFLVGLDGRASTASMSWPNAWDRWTEARTLLLILLVPSAVVGALALRKSWVAVATAAALVAGVPVMSVLISRISPGFAVRTLIPATIGWSLLTSAVMARQRVTGALPGWLRSIGVAGWCYLLVVSIVALPPVYSNSGRVRWDKASADLAHFNVDHNPVITFSIGGMDTDLIDVYAGDRLLDVRWITVVDGKEEYRTGAQRWLDRGPSLHDVMNGKLAELLPDTPENDTVWFLTHRASGSPTVRKALAAMGYQLLMKRGYSGMQMELYARPDADLGRDLGLNGTFAGSGPAVDGWTLPAGAFARVSDTDGAVRELVIPGGDTPIGATAFVEGAPGLYTLEVAAHAEGTAAGARVTLRCLAADGNLLADDARTADEDGDAWQDLIMAVPCPVPTARVVVSLENAGAVEAVFRDAHLSVSASALEARG